MKDYIVTRKRAYWVKETMHVEANSVEEAEYTFFNEFHAELEVDDVFEFQGKQFDEGVDVAEAELDSAELLDQQRQILKFSSQEVEDE